MPPDLGLDFYLKTCLLVAFVSNLKFILLFLAVTTPAGGLLSIKNRPSADPPCPSFCHTAKSPARQRSVHLLNWVLSNVLSILFLNLAEPDGGFIATSLVRHEACLVISKPPHDNCLHPKIATWRQKSTAVVRFGLCSLALLARKLVFGVIFAPPNFSFAWLRFLQSTLSCLLQ